MLSRFFFSYMTSNSDNPPSTIRKREGVFPGTPGYFGAHWFFSTFIGAKKGTFTDFPI